MTRVNLLDRRAYWEPTWADQLRKARKFETKELDAIAIILNESNVPKATINALRQRYTTFVDLSEALKQIEARAVYMQVKDRTYADTHWEYIRQTCRNALSTMEQDKK